MVDQAYVNKLRSFEKALEVFDKDIKAMKLSLRNYTTEARVNTLLKGLDDKINDNANNIAKLQQQLENVIIPDDPRYYLEITEVEEFRKNYKTIISMLDDIDEKYKALVAYTANL